jgi:hypothetical protein
MRLSRPEIEERLKEYDLEWITLRVYNDDVDDPMLVKPTRKQTTRAEQEYALNVGRLHRAPLSQWIESLTVSQIEKVCKEYKIEFKTWFKRTASLSDMRRELSYRLPVVS